MKSLSLALALAALATGCDAGKPVDATSEVDVATAPITECTHIVSAVERLSCFDAAAGTPPAPATPAASALSMTGASAQEAAARKPEIVGLVGTNESMRQPGETEFRISREPDEVPGQWRVVISAPASGGAFGGTRSGHQLPVQHLAFATDCKGACGPKSDEHTSVPGW